VTFDIDANGILNVSAKDKGTGKEQRITITASSGLSKDEIDRMVRDAEAHAEDDRQRRDLIEARNQADSLAYQAEKMLQDNEGKFPSELKTEVQDKIAAVNAVKAGDDRAAISRATDELSEALSKLGQHVYSQAGQGAPGGAAGSQGAGPEGTVEGEFREV
jgi:molecular chaperone DnaK